MKKEMRAIFLEAIESKEIRDYTEGNYTLRLNADSMELLVDDKPVAKYAFSNKFLSTADWDYKKENRYLGYLLEENGFEVHSDNFLL